MTQPDRGFNLSGLFLPRLNILLRKTQCSVTTINYQARQHDIDFLLTPHYGAANLTFEEAQGTLKVTYKKTLLYKDRRSVKTSGLDPLGVRPQDFGFPLVAISDPVMPIANSSFNHLTMDCEGLVVNNDGSYAAVLFPNVCFAESVYQVLGQRRIWTIRISL